MKQLLELPLNLTIVSPAHTPNWDLVSDVVNSCSRIYRSPKQCRSRYENVIIPREEGKVAEHCDAETPIHLLIKPVSNLLLLFCKLVYETNPKKKTKSIYKVLSLCFCIWQIVSLHLNSDEIQLGSFAFVSPSQSKNSRPLRTCQIYTQDDNATHIQLYNSRFELMKMIASKRSPPNKPL